MNSPNLLTRLHQEGLTAHQLRLTFVDQSVGITVWKEGEELDSGIWEKQLNQFISLQKSEIRQAYRSTPEDYQDTLIEAETALDAIDDAERPAMDALIDGQYIGLGYTSHAEPAVTAIPQRHWHFLSVEFDEGSATGNDFQYKGIRFIESEKLNTDQMLAIKASLAQMDTTESDAQDSESLKALGAKLWSDITLRLLKNNFVEVGGPAKKIKVSLDWLHLMNKTEGIPNVVFELLLKMAKDRKVSSKQKHLVSRLRRTLEQKFSLPGDPFQFEKQRGYVPNFKVIDDRNAADERAKNEAVFTTYDNNIDYAGEAKDLESSSDSDELVNQDDYDKGKTRRASLLAFDRTNDLALMKVNSGSSPIVIRHSSSVKVGDDVPTLGYPIIPALGKNQKATFGRINSLSGIKDDPGTLQIDVPLQSGNSGGPLLDMSGSVVGVVSATLSQSVMMQQTGTIAQNVNWAIKSSYLISLLQQKQVGFRNATKLNRLEHSEIIEKISASVVLVVATD